MVLALVDVVSSVEVVQSRRIVQVFTPFTTHCDFLVKLFVGLVLLHMVEVGVGRIEVHIHHFFRVAVTGDRDKIMAERIEGYPESVVSPSYSLSLL